MNINQLSGAVEAVLFACAEPMTPEKIAEIVQCDEGKVRDVLGLISADCAKDNRGIRLLCLNGGYQLATKAECGEVVRRALEIRKNTPLSQAAFETLAVIAYNQPVTRGFVEQVRGIDSSSVISGLVDKGLIEEYGRLDLPGRPMAYQTTENFLRCFGMESLEQLPQIDHNQLPAEQPDTQQNKESAE